MILLTGHEGFVGSSLMSYLPDIEWVTTERDVNSYAFQDFFSWNMRYKAIVHCVGLSIVSKCEQDPLTAFRSNAMSVVSILEGARQYHPGIPIIILESDKVYGNQKLERVTESEPLLGWSPYEKSKVVAAEMCDFYRKYYGMNIISLRLTNTYGPLDTNLSRIIPGTIDRLSRGESPVIWRGSDKHYRDYLYIDDLCEVIIRFLTGEHTPGAYNVTSNENYSTFEVVEMIKRLMAVDIPIEYREKDFSEIEYQEMCGNKLAAELGWKPNISLENGLTKMLTTYRVDN